MIKQKIILINMISRHEGYGKTIKLVKYFKYDQSWNYTSLPITSYQEDLFLISNNTILDIQCKH